MSYNFDKKCKLEGARKILSAWPNSSHLEELISTTEQALLDKSDKALDGAKSLVEMVCKTILIERRGKYDSIKKLSGLVKEALKVLDISSNEENENLRDICSGIITAINGIVNLRNRFGPLSHGRDAYHLKLGDWHRFIAVQTAEAIAVFLFEVHEGKPPNLKYLRRPFDEDDPINKKIDKNVSIKVDEIDNQIKINEFITFRPSAILYNLDRDAYIDVKELLPEDEEDDQENNIENSN